MAAKLPEPYVLYHTKYAYRDHAFQSEMFESPSEVSIGKIQKQNAAYEYLDTFRYKQALLPANMTNILVWEISINPCKKD